MNIRTRFSPAPTGNLHIGSVRTALFNYLFARRNNGSFILRIEDTDKERSKKEFEKDIIEGLNWLQIISDEGPTIDNNEIGDFKPYRQSQRKAIYKKYLEKLLKEKKAYYCFCSKEELEAKKEIQLGNGLAPRYDGKCSLLKEQEVLQKIEKGEDCVIRMKMPEKTIEINDLVRGKISFDAGLIGDIVIAKNLEIPLYNFTVVIDDFEMKITHVIRGEDLLPNTPKQIVICNALGIEPPKYGHLPLILGEDRAKLSKRHGAVSVLEYREQGYLRESIINFLALLGWSPDNDKEFFSINELIKEFEIEKVNKSGAIFNVKKLDYLNGVYIRRKPLREITLLCIPYLIEAGYIEPIFESRERFQNLTGILGKEIVQTYLVLGTNEKIEIETLEKIISLYHERLKKLSEIIELTGFFFEKEIDYDRGLLIWKGMDKEEINFCLNKIIELLTGLSEQEWNAEKIEKTVMPFAEAFKKGDRGYVLWPLRAALTGKKSSAGPFEIAGVFGKEKTIKRLKNAIRT